MDMAPGPSSNQDGEVVNMTRAKEAASALLVHPRYTIMKVEALVLAAAVLLLLQLILGYWKRRWHRSSAVNFVLQLSTKLTNPLVLLTLSMMQSSPVKNSVYPAWAAFLIWASAGTSAFRQHDFYDDFNKQFVDNLIQSIKYTYYVTIFVMLMDPNSMDLTKDTGDLKKMPGSSKFIEALFYVVLFTRGLEFGGLVFLLYRKKNYSLFMTRNKSRSHRRHRTQLQEAADQKRTTEEIPEDGCGACDDSDPRSMKGYKYRVCRHLCRFVTIDQIWDCCGDSADGIALKDLSLSCALFQQLVTRIYFGEVYPETIQHLNKAHDLVFKKLLPSEGDFKRAFRIIEVELGFCYDSFFTKYYHTFLLTNSLPVLQPLILLKMILILAVLVNVVRKSLDLSTPSPIIKVHISNADHIITLVVLVVALIVELLQPVLYLATDWALVSVACLYVKRYRFGQPTAFVTVKVIGILRSFMKSGRLRNKMNQHSVVFGWKQQPDPVEVSDAVKRAIARSLISNHGNNGDETSPARSRQSQMLYSWALKDLSQPQLEVMLIWHIATEYCDAIPDHPISGNGATTRDGHRATAVHLSRYCAFLIGHVPELLPYHEADVTELAQEVMEECEEVFGSKYELSEIYSKMKNLQGTDEEDGPRKILQKGVKLGKQLERMLDGDYGWEVLKDFWAERIIHSAASHYTTKQHMHHLEEGGEFLTHIWALLSHAGVLNLQRDKDQDEVQGTLGSGPSAAA